MWTKFVSVPVLALALVSAACESLGNLGSSGGSQVQTQPIASNVNGTGTIQTIEVVPRSQGLGLGTLAGAAIGGVSGLFSSVSQGAGVMAQSGGGITAMLNRQLGTNVNPQDMRTVQEHIAAGRRDQAIDYMSSNMGVRRDRASTIVDQALILSGSPEQASPEGRAAADRAVKGASTAAWTAFGAVVLSLVFSLIGGALGAIGARRTTWNEHLEGTTAATAQTGLGRS